MSEMLQVHTWLAPLFGGVVGFLIGVIVGVRYAESIQTTVKTIAQERSESKGFSRAMVIIVVSAWVALASTVGWLAVQDSKLKANDSAQIEANERALYTNCVNNNERSKAVLDGWHFILGYELADEDNNPAETEMSKLILPYFDEIYAPRDCNNLSKKYDLPKVPEIPEPANRLDQ